MVARHKCAWAALAHRRGFLRTNGEHGNGYTGGVMLLGAAWTFFMVPILSLCVDWWSDALSGRKR